VTARAPNGGSGGVEFLDEHGRPVVVVDHDDLDIFEDDKPTLPRWLDPRNSLGRTVLGCLAVVLAAWVLSTRELDTAAVPDLPAAATSAPVAQPAPARVAASVTALGPFAGPARRVAALLAHNTPGDRPTSPPNAPCPSVQMPRPAARRLAKALQAHLPRYSVTTAATRAADRRRCSIVLWAQRGSSSAVLEVGQPEGRRSPGALQWQILSSRAGSFEWARRVDGAGRTVLVGSFGPRAVPPLWQLSALAEDPRLSW
jgi:hypothetical protein